MFHSGSLHNYVGYVYYIMLNYIIAVYHISDMCMIFQ